MVRVQWMMDRLDIIKKEMHQRMWAYWPLHTREYPPLGIMNEY